MVQLSLRDWRCWPIGIVFEKRFSDRPGGLFEKGVDVDLRWFTVRGPSASSVCSTGSGVTRTVYASEPRQLPDCHSDEDVENDIRGNRDMNIWPQWCSTLE